MSKTERFFLWLAVMMAGLQPILKKEFIAWFLFFIGLAFIVTPVLMDLVWGANRPDRRAIDAMGGDDYKKLLRNPKSKRYVDWLDSRVGKWLHK